METKYVFCKLVEKWGLSTGIGSEPGGNRGETPICLWKSLLTMWKTPPREMLTKYHNFALCQPIFRCHNIN